MMRSPNKPRRGLTVENPCEPPKDQHVRCRPAQKKLLVNFHARRQIGNRSDRAKMRTFRRLGLKCSWKRFETDFANVAGKSKDKRVHIVPEPAIKRFILLPESQSIAAFVRLF
jgi:hypothetical protein